MQKKENKILNGSLGYDIGLDIVTRIHGKSKIK